MKLKNKFVAVMMIFIIIALIPWIWLNQEYGMNNIPHYNLMMWVFMELYALISGMIGLGITLIALSDEESVPQPKMKRRSNGNNKKRKPAAEKKAHVKSSEKKPRKKAQKKNDGSYSEEDVKLPAGEVEYPAEWDERNFE